MNCHQKKVLTLAGAIANLSFTCVVAGVATYAWFSENDTVTANEMSISSAGSDILIDNYTILKYDDDLKAGVAHLNDSSEFKLPDYDQYIKARNVYSNIVIRAELSFPNGLDTTNRAVEIEIYKMIDSTLKDANGIRLLTSNVAQFQCIATSYTPANSDTPIPIGVGISEIQGTYKSVDDAMYRTAIAYFASRKTPSTFISLMNGQPVDPDNGNKITVVPELYNVGTIKHSVVYLECSYNEKLVDGFVEDHPDEPIHNLEGDIERITFKLKSFSGAFGQNNTGQYIRMNDVGGSYSGQYLASYVGDSNQRVLDGSLASGEEVVGSATGINASSNYLGVNNYIKTDESEVYATDAIDDASLTYDRINGTYRTDNSYYVGNNSNTDGIVSSSSSTDMQNTLSYSGYNATVRPVNYNTMNLQYDSGDSKFAYYGSSKNAINLYRFHENDIVNATLTGFTVSAPTDPLLTYSVGEYFNLRGVSCVATYTKPDNSTFTLNVATVCTYTTVGEGTLIPDKTVLTSIGDPKTITVTYSDRGVTLTGSYNVTVLADVLEYIEITSLPNQTTFVKGDQFDLTGLVVTGHFATVGEVDVTNDCTFKINGTPYAHHQILNISGNNLNVVVHYNGGATPGDFYQDKTFTITIYNYIIDIGPTNEVINVNDNITLDFTFNGNVEWTITGPNGSLSFSSSDPTATTSSTTYTGSDFANQSSSVTLYGLAAGTSTVTATISGTSIKDTCIIRVTDGSELYATYTVTSTSTVTATNDVPAGSTASYTSTYNTKYQLTSGNHMTLTLNGYTGYKITGIVLSMKSNGSSGAGNFEAVVGNSTTISSIATAAFNDPSWNGDWSTSYVNVEPTISVQRTVSNGEAVTLTISATQNSLYCQSFTIYYEQGAVASVSSLQIKDNDVVLNSSTKTISSGSLGMTWTPTAIVTYSDGTTNNSVVWSLVSGSGITVDISSGQVTLNSASGSAVIKATTTGMNSQGENVEATFTLTWSGLTKVLTSIEVDTTNATLSFEVGDTFSSAGIVVTAHYNDESTATISAGENGYTVSTPDMSSAGSKTITITYTEGGVTKTAEYIIQVTNPGGGDTTTYTIVFHTNANDSNELTTSNWLTLETQTNTSVDSNTLIDSVSATSKCYAGAGLKMGSGSATGSFTAVPVTDARSNVVSISISCGQYGSDTGKLILNVNGSSVNNNITPSSGSYTYTPDSPITVNNFGLATTSKRAYVYSITFTVQSGSTPPPTPTLESIAVKTAPTTTTYTAGDYFNPAGLVITLTYSDDSEVDVAYSGHESDFTFDPALDEALTTGDTEVTITYGGKDTTQAITVNSGGGGPVLVQKTATLTFTGACGGSGTDDKSNVWTVTSDAAESQYDGTKGIHYGTGKVAVSYINLTTTITCEKITSIVVNCSGASGTAGAVGVTVGGNTFGTASQNITSSAANYTFTGDASGAIIVSITQASTAKALYCKQIVVTYWVYE